MEILKDSGVIYVSEQFAARSKMQFIISREKLYDLQLKNKKTDVFTKAVLRLYGK